MNGGEMVKARALLGLAALMSGALAACGPFGAATVPQQSCKARVTGALGPTGGVVIPLAARDPTDTANNVSALYALDGSNGKLTWSCVSTTYAGWNDVQQVGGVIYALAGNVDSRGGGAATHAHAIYAIRPRDGKQLWEYSFLAGSASWMAFGGSMLFTETVTGGNESGPPGHNPSVTFPPVDENLLAINTTSGALAWSRRLAGAASAPFTVAGYVVVPLDNGGGEWTLQAYSAGSGAPAWSSQLSHAEADLISVFALGGEIYAVLDRSIVALDGASGATRWTQTLPDSISSQPYNDASALFIPMGQAVAAYNLASGAVRWSMTIGMRPSLWVAQNHRVYAVSYTANNTPDRIVALDGTSGRTLWSRDVSKLQGLSLIPGAGDRLYLTEPTRAQLDETVVALDAQGNEQWRHDGHSPYNYGEILMSGNDVYYIWQAPTSTASNNPDSTFVTCLRASDGAVSWQTALPGVNGDPVGPLVAA